MIFKKFFAAANSAYGFKSYFDSLFFGDDIKRRYIIKGGAGTGKSTFLKALAKEADKMGCDVELYYCSSDTASLDGIIIRDMGICAIDATSPHAYDCKYLGCVDTLLDVTRFLKRELLIDKTEEIKNLTAQSARFFSSGYKSLEAAGALARELFDSGKMHVDMQKLSKTAARLTRESIERPKKYALRIVSSLNARGKTSLTDYFEKAEKFYFVEDEYVMAPLLLKLIEEKAYGKVTAFSSPLLPEIYEAVYLEDTKVLISSEKALLPDKFTRIRAKSFYDGYYAQNKEKIKFESKLINALTDMARESFAKAKESHDSLEKINIAAMDFEAMEKWSKELIREILSDRKA